MFFIHCSLSFTCLGYLVTITYHFYETKTCFYCHLKLFTICYLLLWILILLSGVALNYAMISTNNKPMEYIYITITNSVKIMSSCIFLLKRGMSLYYLRSDTNFLTWRHSYYGASYIKIVFLVLKIPLKCRNSLNSVI